MAAATTAGVFTVVVIMAIAIEAGLRTKASAATVDSMVVKASAVIADFMGAMAALTAADSTGMATEAEATEAGIANQEFA